MNLGFKSESTILTNTNKKSELQKVIILELKSESKFIKKPRKKSESHRLINLQGGNESFRLINTVIESEPRYLRKPN